MGHHKTTGYALREAIKQQELRRDTAARTFGGTLKAFKDQTKEAPTLVVKTFLTAELAIAKLQTAQMRYNLAVRVDVLGDGMTLAEAIKRVGGIARAEKMWRSAAGPKPNRYGGLDEDDVRDSTREHAQATITPTEAVKLAAGMAKRTGAIRQAIAVANAQEMVIEDLDPALFE
jgi:hypothetical protein